ncbi:glycoside hydrolase family 18 protein [Mycena olivaceomarginata]|nr:glycoside hydrolase family 18 protein [Mycena olivaceomarginata]
MDPIPSITHFSSAALLKFGECGAEGRVFSALVLSTVTAFAYDPTRADNYSLLVVYWGIYSFLLRQNSYGVTHDSDVSNWQQTISNYSQDTCIDVIPIGFCVSKAKPVTQICNDNGVTGNCASLAAGIQACQAKGKLVTLSLGGGSPTTARFASDSAATSFADTIWNNFLGGSGSHRPFGAAVLDGVDLDIESGTNTGYAAFAVRIRTRWAGASKPYYITAAPQCPFPDAWVGTALNTVWFDAVYVQFYKAANAGEYISASTLGSIAAATRAGYSNFDGVMLWDASQAYGKSLANPNLRCC